MKSLVTLKSSKDFLEAKKGLFYRSRSFLLQAFEVKNSNEIKVGYTVSKQNGNAVVRNKIKRRLRVLANTILGNYGIKNWNYVIIGKKNVMVEDITTSLLEIDSSIGLDECIRYKSDGTDFTDATVVDDCCCSIY